MPNDDPSRGQSVDQIEIGSTVVTEYTERTMALYGVYEVELRTIGIFNGIIGLFASIGLGLWGFALGLLIDVAKEPEAVTRWEVVRMACITCLLLGTASLIVSGVTFWLRRKTMDEIKNRSTPRAASICKTSTS